MFRELCALAVAGVVLAAAPARAGAPPVEAYGRLPAIESATYFLVAEALTNVAKYAEAKTAQVSVTRLNGAAVVEISDDGIGGADTHKGSGLIGLKDRVDVLGGHMQISSPPGSGTSLRITIPC